MGIAVIADIVGSRRLADRAAAQHTLESTIEGVHRDRPLATAPFAATVGDELQATYDGLADAMVSLLMLQLALPDGIQCRFGIGIGGLATVPSARGALSEGPGWWAAREAIGIVHAKQQRAVPSARTWIVAGVGQDDGMAETVRTANAYLLARDQLVGAMSERARRLAYGRLVGRSQQELARQEGITQPAVSRALRASGALALLDGIAALTGAGS